ncbi:MAG: cobalt-precorrin-5B (C(1))-methyltransferase CbiD [Eubacteriales bacterium]|nr:cobalt-precorrin-5B (C(1))-methyltransferase CbiD [Eubacteriales bacterium]
MRYGFTTGSCAAAAAKAAAYMLLLGMKKSEITIETLSGIPYTAQIEDITWKESEVSCAVRKDGGDDPDVTTGALIYAKVRLMEGDAKEIVIDGGFGVGRVTKPGLDQPVGNAAINRGPREMIEKEVRKVCDLADYKGNLYIEIFVPMGVELAAKTFNPRLGIEGGISILGTSGIVEPMSEQALIDTIYVELRQKRAQGNELVAISPGNYGLAFMQKAYDYDLDLSVKCSNFIGETIDQVKELGFSAVLLTGHIGKLVKVAGGMMNTHSKMGDCRMELIAAAALRQGVDGAIARQILDCVATEEAVRILDACGKLRDVMDELMDKILQHLRRRGGEDLQIECILYANEYGELARSEGAVDLLTLLKCNNDRI